MSFFLMDPHSYVLFRHENENFILPKEGIGLKRYYREFGGKESVDFDSKASHNNVKQFFEFLQRGVVPDSFEDQIVVLQLLNEWECHFSVLISYRDLIQSQTMNGFIYHRNVEYPINIGCLFFHCSVFQEFCVSNINEVFSINNQFSPHSVTVFLDLVHNRISQPELVDVEEIMELCHFFGCSSLYTMINKLSPGALLSTIMKNEHEDSFDFSIYENVICNNLESFIILPNFCEISLPLLIRAFQTSNSFFSISLIQQFFAYCIKSSVLKASILLSLIQLQPSNSVDELNQFMSIFSDKDSNDFFSLNSHILGGFINRFDELKQINLDMKSRIHELETKNEEDKKRIEDQNIVIRYYEEMKKNLEQENKRFQEKILIDFDSYKHDFNRKMEEKYSNLNSDCLRKLDTTMRQLNEIQKQNDSYKEDNNKIRNSLVQKLDTTMRQLNEIQNQNDSYKEDNNKIRNSLVQKLDTTMRQLNEIQNQNDSYKEDNNKIRNSLVQKLDTTMRQLNEIQNQNEAYKEDNNRIKTIVDKQLETVTRQLNDIQKYYNSLKSSIQITETRNGRNIKFNGNLCM